MKKSTLLYAGLALAAAYLIFGRKASAAQPQQSAPPMGTPSGSSNIATQIATAGSAVSSAAGKIWDAFNPPSELRGFEGACPPGGLNGQMAHLGAYGELGGTFYGGV